MEIIALPFSAGIVHRTEGQFTSSQIKSPGVLAQGLLKYRNEPQKFRYFFNEAALSAYFFWNRSTRPAVSINFCLPVKNGWQFEQISTRIILPLIVERVSNVLPQAQCTFTA
jgi:hypothetical protein